MLDLRSWAREKADAIRRLPPRDRFRFFALRVFAACLACALAGGLTLRQPRLVPPEPEPLQTAQAPLVSQTPSPSPPPAEPAKPPQEQPPSQSEAFIYEEHHLYPTPPAKRPPPVPSGPVVPGAKLALVIDDLGESAAFAKKLAALGIPLTLAVMPRLGESGETARTAASAGLDVILHQPMEPKRRYVFNAGSGALTMNLDPTQARSVLAANLAALPQVKGMNNHMGSRYTESPERMSVVLSLLKQRGLFFLDSQTTGNSHVPEAARQVGMPVYTRDVFLDNVRSVAAITDQLRLAERIAAHRGQAIAIGHPYPETLLALSIWATQRDTRLKLAKLSELTPH